MCHRYADELQGQLSLCREELANEKMNTTRALLRVESWKRRSELADTPRDEQAQDGSTEEKLAQVSLID